MKMFCRHCLLIQILVNRKLAFKQITTIRQASQSSKQDVRLFRVPKLDQNMQNLKDLPPPMKRSLTEPPLI